MGGGWLASVLSEKFMSVTSSFLLTNNISISCISISSAPCDCIMDLSFVLHPLYNSGVIIPDLTSLCTVSFLYFLRYKKEFGVFLFNACFGLSKWIYLVLAHQGQLLAQKEKL